MKKYSFLIISLFLLLCMFPSFGICFVGESTAVANEILSPSPKLIENGSWNASFLSDFSDYFSDRFAFRQELSTVWAKVNAFFFSSSVEEKVLLGKEGWLFYTETLDDYMGDVLSDTEIEAVALRLLELKKACEERGAQFLFVIAPNKNSIYGQFMPDHFPHDERSDIEKLYRKLDAFGVNYADLKSAFSSKDEVLYYRFDSHWNNRGAALAADTILEAIGISSGYFSDGFSTGVNHKGDLYEMLYPAGEETEEAYSFQPGFQHSLLNNAKNGNALMIQTRNETQKGSLFCWRDSFGVSLYPFLAESFDEAVFSRSNAYTPEKLEAGSYDTVVLEIVERNILNIIEHS